MGLEFAYQNKYESTIDTLALRDGVRKILQNATIKSNAATDVYQPSNLDKATSTIDGTNKNVSNTDLTGTMNFLKSEGATKLLNLTKRDNESADKIDFEAKILEFKIDESKKNIFIA